MKTIISVATIGKHVSGNHWKTRIFESLRNPQTQIYFSGYFITAVLLLNGDSLPKTTRNMCFPIVVTHS